jgi:hypothetical protein
MAITLQLVARDLYRVHLDGRTVGYVQRRSGRWLPLTADGTRLGRSQRSRKLAVARLLDGPLMAGLRYRGLRLDGPLAEFHRAVDRLRWDTAPPRRDPPPASPPAPPGRGRRQVDDQADLLDPQDREASA